MDPVNLINNTYTVAKELYTQCTLPRTNRDECAALGVRAKFVADVLLRLSPLLFGLAVALLAGLMVLRNARSGA